MKELKIGALNYQCGCEYRDGDNALTASTWIYLGVISMKCTTSECDRPYHYYRFVELESYREMQRDPTFAGNVANIPSLAQVAKQMLSTADFAKEVVYWENAIREGDVD